MTKVRCQVCGGERLHMEDAITCVCDDCGNRSIVIPMSTVERIDNPMTSSSVGIWFDSAKVDTPRKSICLNDTMNPGCEPCKVCKVVMHRMQEEERKRNCAQNNQNS